MTSKNLILHAYEEFLHPCPLDLSPVRADSRCSLTVLTFLLSPLPSTTDMSKRTPAANNRGLIRLLIQRGALSETVIWTWAAAMNRPQCCWELLKSAPVRATCDVLHLSAGLTMSSSSKTRILCHHCHRLWRCCAHHTHGRRLGKKADLSSL